MDWLLNIGFWLIAIAGPARESLDGPPGAGGNSVCAASFCLRLRRRTSSMATAARRRIMPAPNPAAIGAMLEPDELLPWEESPGWL